MIPYLSQIVSRLDATPGGSRPGSLAPAVQPIARPEADGLADPESPAAVYPPAISTVSPVDTDPRQAIPTALASVPSPQRPDPGAPAASYFRRHTERLATVGNGWQDPSGREPRPGSSREETLGQPVAYLQRETLTPPPLVRAPDDPFGSRLPTGIRAEADKSFPPAMLPPSATSNPLANRSDGLGHIPKSVEKSANALTPVTQRSEKTPVAADSAGRLMPVSPTTPQRVGRETTAPARLVIGRISVEVVRPAAPAVQTKPASRPPGPPAPAPIGGETYKLNFGLGQL